MSKQKKIWVLYTQGVVYSSLSQKHMRIFLEQCSQDHPTIIQTLRQLKTLHFLQGRNADPGTLGPVSISHVLNENM